LGRSGYQQELNKALSAVDDSRAEYSRSIPKISPDRDTDGGDPVAASAGYQLDYAQEAPKDFLYWLKPAPPSPCRS
jgi:hypothetical protein